jgi:hypothetical protein
MKKLFVAIAVVGTMMTSAVFASTIEQAEENKIITWAHEAGITKYSTWSEFMPNAPITREQTAKMIVVWMN